MREEIRAEREARERSQMELQREMTQAIIESSKTQFEVLRMMLASLNVPPIQAQPPIPAQPVQAVEPEPQQQEEQPTKEPGESSKKDDEN